VFFALSGYLITKPFFRTLLSDESLPDTRRYIRRRASRIIPAYWLALTVYIVAGSPTGANPYSVGVHYSLLQSVVPEQSRAVFGVAWTLSVEMLFYILVPVGGLALQKIRSQWAPRDLLNIVIGLAVFSFTWWMVGLMILPQQVSSGSGTWGGLIADSLPASLLFFAPGMALAIWELSPPTWYRAARAHPAILGVTAIVVYVVAAYVPYWFSLPLIYENLLHLLLGCSAGLAVLSCLRPGRRLGWLLTRLAPLGLVSYGIYLWHDIIVHFMAINGLAFQTREDLWSWMGNSAIVLAITLPIAAASWYLVEKPAIAWAHRQRAGQNAASEVATVNS
jgi:peptidoglycan/LPS O-acetylase OafA/YrhL